jgi:hypothetical protein
MAFDPNVAMKKCLYRCTNPECNAEWHKWVPVEERKLRRWCPNKCGILVTPYRTEKKQTTEHNVRTSRPKPLW